MKDKLTFDQITIGHLKKKARVSPVFRIRIRMDPGFFADPDPGFKSPDPSINKLMGSK